MIETKSLFSQSRAGGGLAGVRQSVPSTREPAHGSSEFGSVGVGGVVRKVLQVAHALPISEQYGSDNAITSRAARIGRPNARSVGTGHHHMARSTLKEGTPGLLAPRFVRPQPAITWRCGSAVAGSHPARTSNLMCRCPSRFSWNRPLPTWDIYGSCHQSHWVPFHGSCGFEATGYPTGVHYGHRACDSYI